LVLQRANGHCEGCGQRKAVQVHHLTYEHVGQEFLWELRAVCSECHDRLHPDRRNAAA
jgi:5-methylcytosine-specific restriction endonuclease McrA